MIRICAALAIALLAGCVGTLPAPGTTKEAIDLVKKAGGSGCLLIRGNSRPYADASIVAVSTIGKDSDYRECIDALKDKLQ